MQNTVLSDKFLFDFSMLGGLEDDEEFILLLKDTFVSTVPHKMSELSEAIKAQDWDIVRKTAHYLKSNFGNIQIMDAYTAVKEIEEYAAYRKNLDKVADLWLIANQSSEKVLNIFRSDLSI